MRRVGLIGCVGQKQSSKSRAKELYTSDLFVKAKRYSEKHYDKWLILSAKYHLVEPETYIEPYDETLNDKTTVERREWSKAVSDQIADKFPDSKAVKLYFHAGVKYREFLIPLLIEAGYSCEVPLKGLRIGEQLAWYNKHNTHS